MERESFDTHSHDVFGLALCGNEIKSEIAGSVAQPYRLYIHIGYAGQIHPITLGLRINLTANSDRNSNSIIRNCLPHLENLIAIKAIIPAVKERADIARNGKLTGFETYCVQYREMKFLNDLVTFMPMMTCKAGLQ